MVTTTDRTNPFADPAEASWHSACHEAIPDGDQVLDSERLARPEPDQGTGDSPNRAA